MEKKEVKKETKKVTIANTPEDGKMSYEQLNNIAHQLSAQVQQLNQKVQETNMFNTFKRLDYFFKIVELSHMFDTEFVDSSKKEIQEIMTFKEEEIVEDKPTEE